MVTIKNLFDPLYPRSTDRSTFFPQAVKVSPKIKFHGVFRGYQLVSMVSYRILRPPEWLKGTVETLYVHPALPRRYEKNHEGFQILPGGGGVEFLQDELVRVLLHGHNASLGHNHAYLCD